MGKTRASQPEAWGRLRMFANTEDGVFAVNQAGRVVLWNKAATRILGYDAGEALGKRCCDVMRGLDVSGNLLCYPGCQVMILSAREQPIHHFDMRTWRKDGQEIWINISTVVIPPDGERAGGTVHLFRDLTQERQFPGWPRRTSENPAGGKGVRIAQPVSIPSDAGKGPASPLTAREREILGLIASGMTTSTIANKLCISHTTVRNHIQHILAKLGAHSRLEAVTVVFGQHLLAPASR
jgi:PAS domain S-box-containing protein